MLEGSVVRVGIIGFGFMGRMHHRCWTTRQDVRVAAICDPQREAVSSLGKAPGNIAGATVEADLSGVTIYADPGAMLAREDLDAVSITVPTHLHAECTIRALEAGVHVLCEKPMALTLADGRRMMETAERTGKVLQIGHCIRFWPEYVKAKEMLEGGVYGNVVTAAFQRFSATTRAKQGTWFVCEEQSGGMVFDLHIHDTDFIQHLFGIPASVCSHGAMTPRGSLAHIVTHYSYGDSKLVTAEGGWSMTPTFGFAMRFQIVMEKAVLSFDGQRSPTLMLYPAEGKPLAPQLGKGDGYERQIDHFVRRLRGEPVPVIITPRQAWDSLRIAQAERDSVRKGAHVDIVPTT